VNTDTSEKQQEDDVIHWRVRHLEDCLEKLSKDVALLNKAMYMVMGALMLVNVVLPLMEKFIAK